MQLHEAVDKMKTQNSPRTPKNILGGVALSNLRSSVKNRTDQTQKEDNSPTSYTAEEIADICADGDGCIQTLYRSIEDKNGIEIEMEQGYPGIITMHIASTRNLTVAPESGRIVRIQPKSATNCDGNTIPEGSSVVCCNDNVPIGRIFAFLKENGYNDVYIISNFGAADMFIYTNALSE